jgi:hypothetical protein
VGGITLAWLIGEAIIITRQVNKQHHPPVPGALLASSGLFALLAIIAEYPPARPAMTLLAFGVDIAAWLEMPYITPASPAKTAAAGTGKTAAAGTASGGQKPIPA